MMSARFFPFPKVPFLRDANRSALLLVADFNASIAVIPEITHYLKISLKKKHSQTTTWE